MYGSKPIAILKTFLPKEFKRLRALVLTESRDKPELLLLLDLLKKAHPNFTDERIERSKMFEVVFPGMAFNEKALRYLLSDFTKILEEYLIHYRLNQNQKQRTSLLLQSYRDRELDKLFSGLYEKESKKIKKEKVRDLNHYLHQFRISEILSDFEFASLDHTGADIIAQNIDKLDQFYIASKLRSACILQNFQDLRISEYQPVLLNRINELIATTELKEVTFIRIYQKILLTLTDPDNEVHYQNFMDDLETCHDEFTQEGLNEVYSFAKNYCVKKINSSRPEYLKILFELYKQMLERNVLFRGGYLPQWDYKNIITLCCKLNDIQYGERFLEDYKDRISSDFRHNAYHLNAANLSFYKKDFDTALTLLNKVHLSNTNYHIETKTTLMRCYYELEEIIPLFSLFDSFNIYLKRNKDLSKSRKNNYTYFIKYLKRITRIRLGGTVDPAKVKEQMNQEKGMIDISWLNAKVDELIKKK